MQGSPLLSMLLVIQLRVMPLFHQPPPITMPLRVKLLFPSKQIQGQQLKRQAHRSIEYIICTFLETRSCLLRLGLLLSLPLRVDVLCIFTCRA
uniref:Secreted protein n=1 Tax=Picea glauca TaxID=3330 RepID=A0A124GN58_PICGL|nr:hypothetical protein ABT39_MTgene5950 [Picea glauca]